MRIHNYIKITYTNMGYLPGYPYHLISDEEMFDAFLREDGFFADFYPCPDDSLQEAYDELLECITSKITAYLEDGEVIPNWVYSYMIKEVITFESDESDIAYLCNMANVDIVRGVAEFNAELAERCYTISTKWLQKVPSDYTNRPPTMFGEPHVVKSLRLDEANVLIDNNEEGDS